MPLVDTLVRVAKRAGPAWAMALAFTALLGYATFLQITNANAADIADVTRLEKRMHENELEDAKEHSAVSAKMSMLIDEVRGLRADLRTLMSD